MSISELPADAELLPVIVNQLQRPAIASTAQPSAHQPSINWAEYPPMPRPPELSDGHITRADITQVVRDISGSEPLDRAPWAAISQPATSLDALGPMPPVRPAEQNAEHNQATISRAIAKIRELGILGTVREAAHDARTVEITRRRFLQDTAGATGIAAVAGQAGLTRFVLSGIHKRMEANWPANTPTLNFLGEFPRNPSEVALFFPGFGDMHSAQEAEMLKSQGHIDAKIPIAYMDYSNCGPSSIAQLAEVIRDSVPDFDMLDSITIVGRSLGGPIGLGVAALLGKPVKVFMSLSSPFVPGDADQAPIGTMLSRLPDDQVVDASIKYGTSFWNHATKDDYPNARDDFAASAMDLFTAAGGHDSFDTALNAALQGLDELEKDSAKAFLNMWSGADPIALQHELRAWWSEHLSTDPRTLNPAFLRGIRQAFRPGLTKFYYTATDHPATDTTVDVISGAYHWLDFALYVARLPRRDVQIIGLPYDGHANMAATVRQMAPILSYATDEDASYGEHTSS